MRISSAEALFGPLPTAAQYVLVMASFVAESLIALLADRIFRMWEGNVRSCLISSVTKAGVLRFLSEAM